MKTLDCRGLACPQPVMETKKALDAPEVREVRVLVDNATARENVSRFAASQGLQSRVEEEEGFLAIHILKSDPEKEREGKPAGEKALVQGEMVFFIDSDSMGRGSEELGGVLMRSFLHTLTEAEAKPQKIILVNGGVKLACEGSPVLEDLRFLESRGVEILACGTCLNYFELKEKLGAGKISNMYEISSSLSQAGKTVKV